MKATTKENHEKETNETLIAKLTKKYTCLHQHTVAWGEMDAFGHVNNVNFYRYAENARITYADQLNVINDEMYIVIYSSNCKYVSPVVYPDTLHIGVRITEIRNSSFTMVYDMYSEQQQNVVARAEAVVVAIDRTTHAKMSLPTTLKEKIIALEESCGNVVTVI